MIYDQLVRVNKIDNEINDLHAHLSKLYRERQKIMAPASSVEVAKKPLPASGQVLYNDLRIQWQHRGVTIPPYSRLKSQLVEAERLTSELQSANPELGGLFTTILVPPQGTLQKSLEIARQQGGSPVVSYVEPQLAKQYHVSNGWEVLVVIEATQQITDDGLNRFIADEAYMLEGYDCRGLGLQGLLAYGLQTGNWPQQHQAWMLLLKDIKDGHVMCALQRDGELQIDRDDVNFLIGDNFFKPAILVAKKGKINA